MDLTSQIYIKARFTLKELPELMDAIEHNDVDNIIEELGDIVII